MDGRRASSGELQTEMGRESLLLYVFNSDVTERSFRLLSSESLKFLLYQTYTKVIIRMTHAQEVIKEMLFWCRSRYENDRSELENIRGIPGIL